MLSLVSRTRLLPLWVTICAVTAGTLVHAATLELISSAPTNNAVDVSRTELLILQFSALLNAKSVNVNAVTLQSSSGAQKVALSVSGAVITMRPSTPLLPWTHYTLNVSSITGSSGEQLAAPIVISFQTRDASWRAPQLIDHLTAGQGNPATAINAKGVRFVVWQQSTDTDYQIWANRYVPGQASSGSTLVASFLQGSNYISDLKVFVDDSGNAFATWAINKNLVTWTEDGPWTHPLQRLWASRFTDGSGSGAGWNVPQEIDGYPAGKSTMQLRLKFDHTGDAVALWQEYPYDGAPHLPENIVVSGYTKGRGWRSPYHLDTSYSLLVGGLTDLQIDDLGNAYASWIDFGSPIGPQPGDPGDPLMVSHYIHYTDTDLADTWTTPRTINRGSYSPVIGFPVLAVNHRGDAFVMWSDDWSGLQYARTDELGRWGTPILVDVSMKVSPSQLVLLDDGEAFAAFRLGVRQYNPAKRAWTWAHPLMMNQDASSDPRIVADPSGNATVAWTQNINGVNRIYAKRYRANRGWFASGPIDSSSTLGATLQDLLLQPDGSVIATWLQTNDAGTTDVVNARFE